jgi:NADPH:quinone reductase-like Zn-dependent oxidoreductase
MTLTGGLRASRCRSGRLYGRFRATPTLGAVKRVLILGSTGSIGTQALEVIGAADGIQVAGLSAESSWERVLAQAKDHGVPTVALADPDSAERA